jgi:HAD superfamily hydrolase (TIGR01509 family)
MKNKAVVFDFDGVILDTEICRYESWNRVFDLYGLKLPLDAWVQSIGRSHYVFDPFDILQGMVKEKLDRDQLRALHKKYELEIVKTTPVLPGVKDRILEAKSLGIKLAVASSSSRNWVDGNLSDRGLLQYFDVTVCREDTKQHKPMPDPYLTALRILNCEARDSIAVEDSPPGIEAALAAGLTCIAVGCSLTKHLDLSNAHIRLFSLNEISFKEIFSSI